MIALGFHYRKEREREEKRERQKRLAAALKKKQQQLATNSHPTEESSTAGHSGNLDVPRRTSLATSDEDDLMAEETHHHQADVHNDVERKSLPLPTISSLRNGVGNLKISTDDSALLACAKKDKSKLTRMKSSVSFGPDDQLVVSSSKDFRPVRTGKSATGRKPLTASFSLFDRRGCHATPPIKKSSE